MDKNVWVYDIETFAAVFTYTAINTSTEEIVQYVVHKELNQIVELMLHLNQCKGQIGFNNINFDYPIIHQLFIRPTLIKKLPESIIKVMFDKAEYLIAEQNKQSFNKILAIKQSEIKIPQLDLFKIWHFNNVARSTSLKSLQIAMNYPNVMDNPIDYRKEELDLNEVKQVLEYNLNDVLSTYEFYKKSTHKIDLRKDLIKKYNLPCMNFSDTKIGESLTLKLYSELTDQDEYEVKQLRTYRPHLNLEECIFDYIEFKTPAFKELLNKFKKTTLTHEKSTFNTSVIYRGIKYDYGLGGIHSCIKSGVYEATDTHIIIDADAASLYPSIAVLNDLYPEHLGTGFVDVYRDILNQRISAKKEGNLNISDALKLSLNSVYGKSNEENSFLFDKKYTMSITINGQLMLTMLIESLLLQIEDLTVLQVNTDGFTVIINKCNEDTYKRICKEWEEITKLTLEYANYSKMIIADVNNYSALYTNGKVKYKGRFEIDKEYHKDNSFRIVQLALRDYFLHDVPIEKTIKDHRNIYDFCGRQKFKKDSIGETHYLSIDNNGIPIKIIQRQQRNVRYYISNQGATFIKRYSKGTDEMINKGYQVTIFNQFVEKDWKDYNINYSFYVKEALKEVNLIQDKQLTLF